MLPSFFLPLDKQFDDGLGTVARAFHDAAKRLSEDAGRGFPFQASLPVCYLYRHAVELFLKSVLVILWRKYSGSPELLPSIPGPKGKPKSIDREHSVGVLFARLRSLCEEYKEHLALVDPQMGTWPPGLSEAIDAIDEADRASDYFRYPVSRSGNLDAEKSSLRPESLESVSERAKAKPGSVFAIVMIDENKSPVAAYTRQEDEIDKLEVTLAKAADDLSGINAWFDAVLVAGMGPKGRV